MFIPITYLIKSQVRLFLCQVLCWAQSKTNIKQQNGIRYGPNSASKTHLKFPRFRQMFSRRGDGPGLSEYGVRPVITDMVMCMTFILQEGQRAEETLNYLSPALRPQELMSLWEHSNQWIIFGSLGEEGVGTLQGVSRVTVYSVKFNAFNLTTVKKLDYHILEGRLKFGKRSPGRFFRWF